MDQADRELSTPPEPERSPWIRFPTKPVSDNMKAETSPASLERHYLVERRWPGLPPEPGHCRRQVAPGGRQRRARYDARAIARNALATQLLTPVLRRGRRLETHAVARSSTALHQGHRQNGYARNQGGCRMARRPPDAQVRRRVASDQERQAAWISKGWRRDALSTKRCASVCGSSPRSTISRKAI